MTKKVEKKEEKKVEFCILMDIIIIPSKEEFLPYKNELWWNIKELENFKILASYEMFTFMNKNRIYNYAEAKRILYQT